MLAARDRTSRDQNTNRQRDPDQKERASERDEEPSDKFRRRLLPGFWRPMMRGEYEKRSHRRVEERKKRKQGAQPGHDVMKDREQPKMFLIAVHVSEEVIEIMVLDPSPAPKAFGVRLSQQEKYRIPADAAW